MFKSIFKICVLAVLLVGACTLLSNTKAAADSNCIPNPPGTNWGVTLGESANAMAGMVVHSYYGSYTDGSANANNNLPINTGYALNSSNPRGDQRIFQYPPGSAGRTNQATTFSTGETLNGAADRSNEVRWLGCARTWPVHQRPEHW